MEIQLDRSTLESNLLAKNLVAAFSTTGDDRFSALYRVGGMMRDRGAFELAHKCFEEAFSIDPDNPDLLRTLGLSRFRMGQHLAGLETYDSGRWQLDSFTSIRRDFPQREWAGEPIKGKTILLWAEQGVGDQLMQARCLKWIMNMEPAQVLVECDPRLQKMIESSYPGVKTFIQTTQLPEELLGNEIDFHSSLLSAWRWTYIPSAEFRDPFPAYLSYNTNLRDGFRNAWKSRGWDLNVGISWRSKAKVTGDRKSIEPEQWRPLLANQKAAFHSLQYGCDAQELQSLAPAFNRQLLLDADGDAMSDLDRLASQIAALDLVISTD
ncbi:MAG: hypothetical protein AAF226_05445, partial [Verrucomicrobiota bacterium]